MKPQRGSTNRNHIAHPDWKKFYTTEGRVLGIPCLIAWTWGRGYVGKREVGTGLQLEPDEPAGVDEVRLFDKNGCLAPWLEDKVEQADAWDEIDTQINHYMVNDND